MKGSFLSLFVVTALVLGATVGTGQERPSYRVGVLFWHSSPNDDAALAGVREGFGIAGLAATFDVKSVNRDRDLARRTLEAWEADGVDLIYALGTESALRAKETTVRIPVVFTAVTNPVGSQVVPAWDGSGRNLCGNSNWIAAPEVLRVFRAAVPDLARLGVLMSRDSKVSVEEVAEARRHFRESPSQEIKLIEEWITRPEGLDKEDWVRDPAGLREAVEKVLDRGAQALWVPIDEVIYKNLDRVAAITGPRGIPIVSSQASTVRTHAIVAVAVDYRALGRNSVVLADRVLRGGADPGALPVGRMRSFRVLVNLAAAERIGFRVPLTFLAAADEILKPERSVR